MSMLRKSCATIRIVWWSLFPPQKKGDSGEYPLAVNPRTASGRIEVAAEQTRHIDASFSTALDASGRLEIHFADCYFPAAIFVMFRLKREGFSRCRAWSEAGGFTLAALR